jgi:hypothetical protein
MCKLWLDLVALAVSHKQKCWFFTSQSYGVAWLDPAQAGPRNFAQAPVRVTSNFTAADNCIVGKGQGCKA